MSSLVESVEIPSHLKRIFLYIKLKTIENLPHVHGKLEIHLSQAKNTLTKLVDAYPSDNIIDLSIFDMYKPTFSLMIEQDNIEDMNILSDNPLLLTLYHRAMVLVPREEEAAEEQEDEEEEQTEVYEEQLISLAQGHIDLLKLYTKKRESVTFHCILYPLTMKRTSFSSITTAWEIYALLPLLKDLSIHNVAYISFESIFNVESNLGDIVDFLVADLCFESKVPNKDNQYDKIKLCTFDKFYNEKVAGNSLKLTWASLKEDEPKNYNCLGIFCDTYVNVFNIFRKLVRAEHSKINFETVSLENHTIGNNSTHRYVLTEQFVRILEDVIAFDEQQLLVELYHIDNPDKIIAQGRIDLSIMLYPNVNSKRFVVELYNMDKIERPRSKMGSVIKPVGPTFAIISICLLTPLTGSFMLNSMDIPITKRPIPITNFRRSLKHRVEAYHKFENQIKELIFYIIQNDIKKLDDARNIFCCYKENLNNKFFKLISCDFNIRKPTKDSIEFHNLLTSIYSYGVQCTYDKLLKFGNRVPHYWLTQSENGLRIIGYLSTSQYLSALGEEGLAKAFCDKAEKLSTANTILTFFKLVMDVEKQDFQKAKKYYLLPKNAQFEMAVTFTELIRIYIIYVENLADEDTFNKAMEYLIVNLRNTIMLFPGEISLWVLLHCVFKYCGYLPGINYTRWRYEQLPHKIELEGLGLPTNRFELVNSLQIQFPNSPKKTLFLSVFKMMIRLGLYKFAEFIFKECEDECTASERYLIQTTLRILTNEVPAKYPAKSFPINKSKGREDQETEKALLLSVNGHLEYSRGAIDLAMQNYGSILMRSSEIEFELYSLALLRYGFHMLSNGLYENAVEAFNKSEGDDVKIIANFGLGKALFKMKRLEEAEQAFANCTTFKVHIPDVWGYLALINLLQNENFKALEFWKYAKIHPNVELSEDLMQELANVDIYNVKLFVDKPSVY
ncbi:uncharacterized protein LOC128864824 [Anastrepha ludens]|uniref:uncharacterized protein LOC128864824 n=1 Tax=Anastrepha ludens TaxID=28586 RepID=UPI0023B0EE71|nr:uncharacterized protein LOC128864824 [Anastrepha ludens]